MVNEIFMNRVDALLNLPIKLVVVDLQRPSVSHRHAFVGTWFNPTPLKKEAELRQS
jgi:hypothetical protein